MLNSVERNDIASITILPNICGDAATGVTSNVDLGTGQSSGCVSSTTPFDSFLVTGQWLAYQIWTDAKCTQKVEISKYDGTDNCYVIKNGGALAYSYDPRN